MKPNGICTTIPVINQSLEEIGAELRDWIDGEENIKLDKWYKEFNNYSVGIVS